MRYFLLFTVTFVLLFSKDEHSCYSVQLSSFIIKDRAAYRFEEQGYPDSCILATTEKMDSVRCGCYEEYSKAKALLEKLRGEYPQATVVTTYRSRFTSDQKKITASDAKDQELRLLFQVFTYSSDLENAYSTAKKALRLYPKSLYWHQKAAEVSMWTDRRQEAVEHMIYLYSRGGDKTLEEKVYQYALSAYQYKTAALIIEKRVRKDPSEKNIKEMLYIFDLVGRPMESAEILDELYEADPSLSRLLTQQLQIYLNMGEMDRAGKVVEKIQNKGINDLQTASLISHYYFLKRDMDASYRALIGVDAESMEGNTTQYYMQLSDLSWYLQEYKKAGSASLKVDEAKEARLVDYERILALYKEDDPERAMKAALDAYEKFGQNYLFYTYAYLAMQHKRHQALSGLYEKIEKEETNTLLNEAMYWVLRAQLYGYLNRTQEARSSFEKAKRISKGSSQIIEAYIWFLIDIQDAQGLSELLLSLENEGSPDQSLWLPMAVAYFNLQQPDRALHYINTLRKNGTESTEVSLLYAYIKQAQGEEGAFYKQMRSVYKALQMQLQKNPLLEKNGEFMASYLNVSLYFLGADDFEKRLSLAKPYLSPKAFEELSLSWALRENVDEQVHRSARSLLKSEAWIRLNIALSASDRSSQQELLYRYFRSLPTADSVSAATNSMQIAFAQDLLFEGVDKNEKNSLLYDQMRQLHNEYADHFLLEGGVLERGGLSQSFSEMHNSYYLARAYSLESDLLLASDRINDNEVFKSVPDTTASFGVGIKKRFERGYYQIDAGLRDSAERYSYLSFKYATRLSERLNMELLLDKGGVAEESVYLLVGGYKDRAALQTRYSLLGSSQIGLYLEKANYLSQDGTELGNGVSGRLEYSYLQRSAYPDILISPYYSFGSYSEKSGTKGIIDDLLPFPDTQVISDDFWYLGTDLSYGMENRYNYVRVWRPFFSFSPYYNGGESQFNYGFSAGVGGELFGQDNFSLAVDYSQSVGGRDDTLWRSYFRYKILY